jgi:hypothetical protein
VKLLGLVCAVNAIVALIVVFIIKYSESRYRAGEKAGYEKGFKEGFDEGKLRTDNWWISLESQILEERKQMWRKEAQQ